MQTTESQLRAEFDDLRAAGKQATEEGRLPDALGLYEACSERAQALDDPDLIDLAFCNRCAIQISLGRHEGLIRGLREILSRSTDRINRLVAAYNLSRIYEFRNDTRKGLLYARIARGEHEKTSPPSPYWEAILHNQAGSFLLLESRFPEAAQEYRRALEADPEAAESQIAVAWLNLGYCHLVLGDHRRGFELAYRALRVYRRCRLLANQMSAHLDLCYGLLEIGRYRPARRHAVRALRLAEGIDHRFGLKNALYLLGEAEHLLGNDDEARDCFDRLQVLFPDTPYLSDLLMAVDLRQMLNLRA